MYNTPADQPPPPPQWATGVVSSGNPLIQPSNPSGTDFAFGHAAEDYDLDLLVQPRYQFLLGGSPAGPNGPTGNYQGHGDDTGRLHSEWEDLTIPKFVWAEPGDRVTEKGSWVWDCGHWGPPTTIFSPDYTLTHEGQPCPYDQPLTGLGINPDQLNPTPVGKTDPRQCEVRGEGTEFHPFRAIWVQRRQSATSPAAESQADLFVSTDKTVAGKVADCAHEHPPPPVPPSGTTTHPALYGPDFGACVDATEPNWQTVSGHYAFVLPAPPRPAGSARLTYRVVDHGSTANAPVPRITPRGGNAIKVSFDINSHCCQRLAIAYTFYAGWDVVPAARLPTHLRVTFDKLVVHRMMTRGCTLGEINFPGCANESTNVNQLSTPPAGWNLFLDVNGVWSPWEPRPTGGSTEAERNGELLVDHDEQTFPGQGRSVELYVPPGKGWRLYVAGRVCHANGIDPARRIADCPTNNDLADSNDVPGMILDSYPSAVASLGTHTSDALTAKSDPESSCPDDTTLHTTPDKNPNPHGCYSLTYTVVEANTATGHGIPSSSPAAIRLTVRPLRAKVRRLVGFHFLATALSGTKRVPVRGATIRFAGRRTRTNALGRATIVKRFNRRGRHRAFADKRGLRRGVASVQIVR